MKQPDPSLAVEGDRLPTVILGLVARHTPEQLRPRLANPDPGLRLSEDLGLDSLALMEVALQVDDTLQVKLSDDDLRSLHTIGDLLRLVREEADHPAVSRPENP